MDIYDLYCLLIFVISIFQCKETTKTNVFQATFSNFKTDCELDFIYNYFQIKYLIIAFECTIARVQIFVLKKVKTWCSS